MSGSTVSKESGESRRSKETRSSTASKDTSSSSSSESNLHGSKQVQFGVTPSADDESSKESESSATPSDESATDNVNERLRHQAPTVEHFVEIKQLDSVTANMCTIILQVAYQEICILRNMNFTTKVPINLEYVPLDEKYNNADYDMEIIMNPKTSFLTYKKFKREVCWLEEVLWMLIINLQKDYYYDDFIKILNDNELTRQEEKMLVGAKEFNRKELQKLKFYIDREKCDFTKRIQKTTEELGNSKDELNDSLTESVVKINYLKEWEKSRHEQNKMKLVEAENKLLDTKRKMEMETEKEERVHEEMWLFLENALEDYKNQIEKWMEKYDRDLEEKEQQVARMKILIQNQKDKYEEISREYNKRQREIDEYKEYKLIKEQEAEELRRRNQAATRIQSWWRGVMFRKGLGPFRRKKPKAKKGGSGKK